MSQTVSRILWAVVGILLLVAGMICLSNPGVALATLSLYLGVAMLLSGVIDIVIFAKASRFVAGAGWFLAEGILTVLLSLFLLFHQAFTLLSLPYIFGMWLLFSGISKFVSSFDLRALDIRGWGWCTAIGALLALAGFLAFLDPVSDLIAISVLVGLLLVFQGIVSLLRALFSHRLWR